MFANEGVSDVTWSVSPEVLAPRRQNNALVTLQTVRFIETPTRVLQGRVVVADPTELLATLAAARCFGECEVVALFVGDLRLAHNRTVLTFSNDTPQADPVVGLRAENEIA